MRMVEGVVVLRDKLCPIVGMREGLFTRCMRGDCELYCEGLDACSITTIAAAVVVRVDVNELKAGGEKDGERVEGVGAGGEGEKDRGPANP